MCESLVYIDDNEYEHIIVESLVKAYTNCKNVTFFLNGRDALQWLEKNKAKVEIESNETSQENVFIGGDAFRGPSTVVESIADGKKVAEAIIKNENLIPEIFSFKIDDAVFK